MRIKYIHFELFNTHYMEKKDILESLINYYTDGNKAQFAAKLGVKPQTINTWIGRNSFDVELVYSKCEGVSGDWLLSGGEGEMLRNSQKVNSDMTNIELIKLRAENDVLRELVNLRKKNDVQVSNVG